MGGGPPGSIRGRAALPIQRRLRVHPGPQPQTRGLLAGHGTGDSCGRAQALHLDRHGRCVPGAAPCWAHRTVVVVPAAGADQARVVAASHQDQVLERRHRAQQRRSTSCRGSGGRVSILAPMLRRFIRLASGGRLLSDEQRRRHVGGLGGLQPGRGSCALPVASPSGARGEVLLGAVKQAGPVGRESREATEDTAAWDGQLHARTALLV